MVLIPGYLARRKIWALQAFHLSRSRRVLLYDPRGAGDSDVPKDGYGLETQVDDLLAVVEDVGWSRFDLVGHSMGGFLAMALAIAHPERVRRLALLATAPYRAVEPDLGVDLFSHSAESGVEWAPGGIQRAADRLLPEADLGWLREEMQYSIPRHTRPDQALAAFGIYDESDLRPRLPGVDSPTLVLHGDRDDLLDVAIGRQLALAIPGARFHQLEGLGHLLMITGAREVSRVLDEFLGGGPSTQSVVRA